MDRGGPNKGAGDLEDDEGGPDVGTLQETWEDNGGRPDEGAGDIHFLLDDSGIWRSRKWCMDI